jgi:CO/xanthine dehydrogenase Mo-binding subunit
LGNVHKLIEGQDKVSGRVKYTADLKLAGMVYLRPVLSPHAHASIVSFNLDAARLVPGVVAVLTDGDLCTRNTVINSRSSAVLARGTVMFRGQPVVAVVAESEAAAQSGAEAVEIEYALLPAVVDPVQALTDSAHVLWPSGVPKEGADLTAQHCASAKETGKVARAYSNLHNEHHFVRGNVEQGFAEAHVVVERVYRTPIVHQGYLEPHAVVCEPDVLSGSITIYTSTQGQYIVRDETARILRLAKRQVRVVPMAVGGGFGAKYGSLEPLVGAVALAVGRPVQLVLTSSEDFLTTTPSPGIIIELKTGANREGRLTALEARVNLDNGAYPFELGGIVGMLLGGYYQCANVDIKCLEVLTNKPQSGAYRAPGAPSATLAIESNIDDLALALGMDPLEFRYANAVKTGDPCGNGDPWPNIGLKQCLERMRVHPLWQHRSRGSGADSRKSANGDPLGPSTGPARKVSGVGVSVGGWPCFMGPAAAMCRVDSDGTVRVHVGTVDVSGVNSSYGLVAAEVLGVSADNIEIIQGDTSSGPFGPNSGGSQTTYSVAGAVAGAALVVRDRLLQMASDHFEASVEDLEVRDGFVYVKGVPDRSVSFGALASTAEGKKGGPGPVIGEGRAAVEEYASGFGVHLARVEVDIETGHVEIMD